MDSDYEQQEYRRNHFHQDHIIQSHEFQQHMSCSGLTPYRSAPTSCISSFLAIPGTNNYPAGDGRRRADFQQQPLMSPAEAENMFANLLSSTAVGGGGGSSGTTTTTTTKNDESIEPENFPVDQYSEQCFSSRSVKLEISEAILEQQQRRCSLNSSCDRMMCSSEQPAWTNQDIGGGIGSTGQMKKMSANNNNNNHPVRQRSSPPGLFIDEGFGAGLLPTRNPKLGGQNMEDIRRDGGGGDKEFGTGYPIIPTNSSWGRYTSRLQIEGDDDDDDEIRKRMMFSADQPSRSSASDQNQVIKRDGASLLPPLPLAHHLSLPLDKMLQLPDRVPCKVRARRGCATHPRSIAERVRRTKISERIRMLQDVVPNMDKQTNTADMLDLAVDYIKDLQKQLQTLGDNRAKCTCLC